MRNVIEKSVISIAMRNVNELIYKVSSNVTVCVI
jgi:hypothetical protein